MAANDERFIPQIPEALNGTPRLLTRINKEIADIYAYLHRLEGRSGESILRDHLKVVGRLTLTEDPDTTLHEVGSGEVRWDGRALRLSPAHFAMVNRSTDQTIGTGSLTALDFDTTLEDTAAMVNLTANNSAIFIQAAGVYMVGAHIEWQISGTNRREIRLYKGTTALTDLLITEKNQGAHGVLTTKQSLAGIHRFAQNEVLSLHVLQDSGGDLVIEGSALSPVMWAFRLWTDHDGTALLPVVA